MGLPFKHPSALGVTIAGEEDRLATVLGLAGGGSDLQHLIYPPESGKPGWVRFFGTPVRWKHVANTRRRVSPRSLRCSPYCKAIWSMKVFSFDPATKETLLDECPVCSRAFRYMWTRGPLHCAHCTVLDDDGFVRAGVDLREYLQPLIEVDDVEALDWVTGLVDPNADVRQGNRPKLDSVFADYHRGDLFEFVVALACALTSDPFRVGKTLHRPSTNDDYMRFTPLVLSEAGRILLDWPDSLHRAAARVRDEASKRPGHYGIQKELGPLLAVTMDPHVHPNIRKLLYQSLHDNMEASADAFPTVRRAENRYRPDYVTMSDAAGKIKGCNRKQLSKLARRPEMDTARASGADRGPVLFNEAQLVELYALREKLISSQELANALGVPRLVLRELASAGHIFRETGPVVECLTGNEYYHREPAFDLINRMMETARIDAPPLCRVRLSNAVNRLVFTNTNPWPLIVQAIVERRIDVWKIDGNLTAVMTSLAVANLGALGDLLVSSGVEDICDGSTRLMQHDASLLLNTTAANVSSLVCDGLLPKNMTLKDVYAFKERYLLTTDVVIELRNRGRICNQKIVHDELGIAGITPVHYLKWGKKSVWSKPEIDNYLVGLCDAALVHTDLPFPA